MLLGGVVVFLAAAYGMRYVLFYKFESYYWSRYLSGFRFYVNDITLQIGLAACAAGLLWFSLLSLKFRHWHANALANSVILPFTVGLSYFSFTYFFRRGLGEPNPSLILLAFIAPLVIFLSLAKLAQKVPDFRFPPRTYVVFALFSVGILCFLFLPFRNQKLLNISDAQKHARAADFFGETYVTAFNAIQDCPSFKAYAGKLTKFVPALQTASGELRFVESEFANYTFMFEGEKRSGLVGADIYFKGGGYESTFESALYVFTNAGFGRSNGAMFLECESLWSQFD